MTVTIPTAAAGYELHAWERRTVHALRALASRVEAGTVVVLATTGVVRVDLRGAPRIEVSSLLAGIQQPHVDPLAATEQTWRVEGKLLTMQVLALLTAEDARQVAVERATP